MIKFFHDTKRYAMFWDVHTYYNAANHFSNQHDIFTESYLSMNLLAVPLKREDLLREFRAMDMVEVDAGGGKYYLEEYTMNYKGNNVQINQLGTEESCIR